MPWYASWASALEGITAAADAIANAINRFMDMLEIEESGYCLQAFGIIREASLTLPLSGRHGARGGEAENLWWPAHSRGLLGCDGVT